MHKHASLCKASDKRTRFEDIVIPVNCRTCCLGLATVSLLCPYRCSYEEQRSNTLTNHSHCCYQVDVITHSRFTNGGVPSYQQSLDYPLDTCINEVTDLRTPRHASTRTRRCEGSTLSWQVTSWQYLTCSARVPPASRIRIVYKRRMWGVVWMSAAVLSDHGPQGT